MKKRYFVVREESPSGPARLEYYDNEKKFKSGHAIPKKVVDFYECFNINKKHDSKHKHAIALYTGSDCFSLVFENEKEQEEWLALFLELQGIDENSTKQHFEHVWQVTVKPRGLGSSKNLVGTYRLCLTSSSLSLVKLNHEKPEITFQLAAIRRCGHSDCFFFMEVGRSSATGAGELWMQVEDTIIAQNMHEAILSSMKSMSSGQEAGQQIRPRTSSTLSDKTRPASAVHRSRDDHGPHRSRTSSEGHKRSRHSPTVMRKDRNLLTTHAGSHSSVSSGHSPMTGSPLSATILNESLNPSGFRGRSDSTDSRGTSSSISDECDGHSGMRSTTPDQSQTDSQSDYLSMTPNTMMGASPVGSLDSNKNLEYMEMDLTSKFSSPHTPHHHHHHHHHHHPPEGLTLHDINASSSKGAPSESSYMSMTPTSSLSSSPRFGTPSILSDDSSYLDMAPLGQGLPPLQEKATPDGYMDMAPTHTSGSRSVLRPAKSFLHEAPEFPQRAYSVGSRPGKSLSTQIQQPYMEMVASQGALNNSKSSSAPHLENENINANVKSTKGHTRYASPSPSGAREGGGGMQPMKAFPPQQTDLFMEMDFARPRTASDSFNYQHCRPRTSSWSKAMRPRSASHSQGSKINGRKLLSRDAAPSQELIKQISQDSLRRSYDSISKLGSTPEQHEAYMEMSPQSSSKRSPATKPVSMRVTPVIKTTLIAPDYMMMNPVIKESKTEPDESESDNNDSVSDSKLNGSRSSSSSSSITEQRRQSSPDVIRQSANQSPGASKVQAPFDPVTYVNLDYSKKPVKEPAVPPGDDSYLMLSPGTEDTSQAAIDSGSLSPQRVVSHIRVSSSPASTTAMQEAAGNHGSAAASTSVVKKPPLPDTPKILSSPGESGTVKAPKPTTPAPFPTSPPVPTSPAPSHPLSTPPPFPMSPPFSVPSPARISPTTPPQPTTPTAPVLAKPTPPLPISPSSKGESSPQSPSAQTQDYANIDVGVTRVVKPVPTFGSVQSVTSDGSTSQVEKPALPSKNKVGRSKQQRAEKSKSMGDCQERPESVNVNTANSKKCPPPPVSASASKVSSKPPSLPPLPPLGQRHSMSDFGANNNGMGESGPGKVPPSAQDEPQLNYASLDLGSSEDIELTQAPKSPRIITSRHNSGEDGEKKPTYAEIDFEKSESFKQARQQSGRKPPFDL
ncbi:insulin receptor substrate 1-B isoform X2 [Lingula anatina]|nr:insulin receptor substrate 1-B isoform X2 [Lingula anatina]|eukprot:XP_023932904.1 insulin receptor substrate 1-B isoform X2 [Lingula anatina]